MASGRKRSALRRPLGEGITKRAKLRPASAFRYQALIPARYEIRLLEVLPARPDSRVTARLFHVSLDDAPHFDALSYMWGAPRPTYDIKVTYGADHLTRFPINRNLHRALDDLRFPDRPRVLWIDAICINQADPAKRAQQVKLMRRIYPAAQRVCAWVDHGVVPTLHVFDDLQQLGESIEIENTRDPDYWRPELILAQHIDVYCRRHRFDGQKLLLFQQKVLGINLLQLQMSDPGHQLKAYMHSTYDKEGQQVKTKVKEKLRPAREAINKIRQLCLNKEHVPKDTWEGLLSLYRLTAKSATVEIFHGGILRAKRDISRAQKRSEDKSGLDIPPEQQIGSLMDLFAKSLSLRMTDPRDRVYGVLGLATDTNLDEVIVDYDMPLPRVFSQVFRLYIQQYKSLSFLCKGPHLAVEFLPDHEFPSWMPVREGVMPRTSGASHASGGFKADNAQINTETHILSVEGVMVDTVSFVGDREPFNVQPVVYWLEKLEHYCRRLWPASEDGPLYEREDVTELLFPFVTPERYWKSLGLEKPTPEQRLDIVRSLIRACSRPRYRGLSLKDAGFRRDIPLDLLTPEQRLGCRQMYFNLQHTTFLGTKGGRLATMNINDAIEVGDQVWIILGCNMPVILRPVEGTHGRYSVVGPVIMQGLMNGEGVSELSMTDEGRISPECQRQIELQ
ncbi:heterokaryon incompatibility protein-domain-containing protein [Xylaria grammica]|nr:heterokaryon incompatibility protein-domain-containing protein [Xylaria grammica]